MAAVAPRATWADFVPGIAAAIAVALGARFLSEWVGTSLLQLGRSPVSPVMLAVLAGVGIRSAIGAQPQLERGVAVAASLLLRVGIALVGLRLTLAGLGAIGLRALPVVAGCLAAAWLLLPRLARAFGLKGPLVTLLTVGTSICGCTAVMAVAPVIRARAEETGYAVTLVVVVGLTGMLVYPAAAHGLLGLDPQAAGIFLGTAIHDTSQVIGAALLYSSQHGEPAALDAATVTKLLRNLALVAVVPALAVMHARTQAAAGGAPRAGLRGLVPGFIVAFVAMVVLRTAGDAWGTADHAFAATLWAPGLALAERASDLLLTVGMAAVGLTVELGAVRRVGWRPLAAGAAAAALMAAVSLALVTTLA
jgi:uncharacterized integral membrane protein (TIGR00698 family)